jgi:hypothetical protein
MKIIGVDVGLSGAISVLDINTLTTEFYDLPTRQYLSAAGKKYRRIDDQRLLNLIRQLAEPTVACFVVESQSGFGPIPGATKFGLGDCFGLLRGLILSTRIGLETVKPQTWKKEFRLFRSDEMTQADIKEASRQHALRLFPGAADVLRRKMDHNRAESLLIAEWGRRHVLQKYVHRYQAFMPRDTVLISDPFPITSECKDSIA